MSKEEAEYMVRVLERMERCLRRYQDRMRARGMARTDSYHDEIYKAWSRIWALKMETKYLSMGQPRSKTVVKMCEKKEPLKLLKETNSLQSSD